MKKILIASIIGCLTLGFALPAQAGWKCMSFFKTYSKEKAKKRKNTQEAYEVSSEWQHDETGETFDEALTKMASFFKNDSCGINQFLGQQKGTIPTSFGWVVDHTDPKSGQKSIKPLENFGIANYREKTEEIEAMSQDDAKELYPNTNRPSVCLYICQD